MLQYVNGERDSQVTGHGPVHIADYAFRHYVLGQIPIVLDIVAPCSFGFPKRFHEVWALSAEIDDEQECEESLALPYVLPVPFLPSRV